MLLKMTLLLRIAAALLLLLPHAKCVCVFIYFFFNEASIVWVYICHSIVYTIFFCFTFSCDTSRYGRLNANVNAYSIEHSILNFAALSNRVKLCADFVDKRHITKKVGKQRRRWRWQRQRQFGMEEESWQANANDTIIRQ